MDEQKHLTKGGRRLRLLQNHLSHEIRPSKTIVSENLCAANATREENFLPIFVSNIVFPNSVGKYLIHEPKYILLVQDVLNSTSQVFGICMRYDKLEDEINEKLISEANKKGFCDYGSLVRIIESESLKDGRLIVKVEAISRFHVAEVSEQSNVVNGNKVSYHTGRLNIVEDLSDKGEFFTEQMSRLAFERLRNCFQELHCKVVAEFPHPSSLTFLTKVHGMENFPAIFARLKQAKDEENSAPGSIYFHSSSPSRNTFASNNRISGSGNESVDVGDIVIRSNAFEEACDSLNVDYFLDANDLSKSVWNIIDVLNLPEHIKYGFLSSLNVNKRLAYCLVLVQKLNNEDSEVLQATITSEDESSFEGNVFGIDVSNDHNIID